jgi:hypothetical protein
MNKIGPITFNCRERLRRHRGRDRNFDSAAMAAVVNSPAVQERVAKGDMLGYYGHLPRVMFGMEPGEAAVHNGKMVLLEPAIATTKLTAGLDGVITHEVQFLDTAGGRMAARLHGNNKGGFSSAISCRSADGKAVPYEFHGFDFVFEPNFSGNRGYCLDGVLDGVDGDNFDPHPGAALDSVAAGRELHLVGALDGMLASMQSEYELLLAGHARLQAENVELMSILTRRPEHVQAAARSVLAALDSAAARGTDALSAARRRGAVSELREVAEVFDSVALVQRVEEPRPAQDDGLPQAFKDQMRSLEAARRAGRFGG